MNCPEFGLLQVTLLDTLELAHYTIRTFRLQHRGGGEVREVRHLQYTAWPDHGVPDHPTPFLMFLKRVKTLNQPDAGPIISHCRFVKRWEDLIGCRRHPVTDSIFSTQMLKYTSIDFFKDLMGFVKIFKGFYENYKAFITPF